MSTRRAQLERYLVTSDTTVDQVIRKIDEGAEGIVLLVDPEGRLIDTVTDGDVRRAFLAGVELTDAADRLISLGKRKPHAGDPVLASSDMSDSEILQLMTQRVVRQVPIIDRDEKVIDLVFMHELVEELEAVPEAVVMAGGAGSRLLPLTQSVPKPLLKVGDKPVIERIVKHLQEAGITKVNVAVHHMWEQIAEHLGDGSDIGIDVSYVREEKPLGTAGSLRKLTSSVEPLLVINADIVTNVSFRALLNYHKENRADITVGVRRYEVTVPYGVLECEGPLVQRLTEKPVTGFLVNAGIYLVQPDLVSLIPEDSPFDMTELLEAAISSDKVVCAFPIHEYWLDIGRHEDYESAQAAFEQGNIN